MMLDAGWPYTLGGKTELASTLRALFNRFHFNYSKASELKSYPSAEGLLVRSTVGR